MTKFKVGPAKLRDGTEAEIFCIDDKIYGRVKGISGWFEQTWHLNGFFQAFPHEKPSEDLMPNVEPLKCNFKVEWVKHGDGLVYPVSIDKDRIAVWSNFVGLKGSLVFTQDLDLE